MRHDKTDTLYLKLGHDNADDIFEVFKKKGQYINRNNFYFKN